MNDWTDTGSYAYNKLLREREADETLLRQCLQELEYLQPAYDGGEYEDPRDLTEIEIAGDLWPIITALRERLK
jgi:hypothetical protein